MDRLTPKTRGGGIATQVPLQRQGEIDDIANASVFLFSEAANWINGQVIVRAHSPASLKVRVLTARCCCSSQSVDGGHKHTAGQALPYPESVLNPEKMAKLIKPRL